MKLKETRISVRTNRVKKDDKRRVVTVFLFDCDSWEKLDYGSGKLVGCVKRSMKRNG